MWRRLGVVAQLGERVVRNDEVRGSIPLDSTKSSDLNMFAARKAGAECDRQIP